MAFENVAPCKSSQKKNGKISFIKRDAGSGHVVYRVIWTRASESTGQAIAWLQPGQKPTAELALFYCKLACAKEDGLDQYRYHDKQLTPPKRMPRERNAA